MTEVLIQGDCLEQMKTLEDNSVDSIVTDPPYGLSFMGKKWDIDVPSVEVWQEAIRVLKPGGHLISFGGTRTYHRMAVAIEDAGFEIRDMVSWIYGSGFPKSLNISKAIDKSAGVQGEIIGEKRFGKTSTGQNSGWNDNKVAATGRQDVRALATEEAKQWNGWGTALKPAQEPCVLARKPLSEKTVAANVLKWGTGGLNIDGSRVGTETVKNAPPSYRGKTGEFVNQNQNFTKGKVEYNTGRFPANIIHDGSDEVLDVFPNDSHRFFYCPKTSKAERNRGCEGLEEKDGSLCTGAYAKNRPARLGSDPHKVTEPKQNHHPTVKPIALMEYMVKLITHPGGTVLDPYMGSGSTGMAAKGLGCDFIGIELDKEYMEIAKNRIESVGITQ